MAIYQLETHAPDIVESSFIRDSANIIGKVIIKDNVSIWDNVTIRGDNEYITINQDSNIQESCVLHTDMGYPLTIGQQVTVGHQAMLHGCTIGDGSLIGIQAVILNGAIIGKNCLVGAGALVTEGKHFPDNSLILGTPAKVVRSLTPDEIEKNQASAKHYVTRGQYFKKHCVRIK